MNPKHIVRALIEKRQIEAIKKQIGTKMTVIAQNFGKPIVASGINHSPTDQIREENGFFIEDFAGIRTAEESEEWNEYEMGWYFDGLRFGINMSILILVMEDRVVEIKGTYNSYVVFSEVENKVRSYAPFPKWEKALEDLYEGASKADRRKKERLKQEELENKKNQMSKVWQMLKTMWGA